MVMTHGRISLALAALMVAAPAMAAADIFDGVGGPERQIKRQDASACAAEKVSAAGEYMRATLACTALDDDRGRAAGRACVAQAVRELTRRFKSAERPGSCSTVDDAAEVMRRVDEQVAGLVAAIDASLPKSCAIPRLHALGQDADRQHACYADAVAKGAGFSVDPACQDNATAQFLDAYDRQARRTACAAGAADGPSLDEQIRSAVRRSRTTVAPPVTSCRPITPTTLHGGSFRGNSRLTLIEHGQVPCMHVDDGTIASCTFSTSPSSPSGEWLDSSEGPYALVGQSLSLSGAPGGDYVVAARVSDAAPSACIEPSSMDTLGRIPEGIELASVCTVEDLGSAYNAMAAEWGWTPLWNFADSEVCMANGPNGRPHPDLASLVRSYASSGTGPDDTFCYTGYGAALNDINGAERDWLGGYYPGEGWCHYIAVNGYEVPAAKRPATRSLPAPGRVDTSSYLLWRPVNPNVSIANGSNPQLPRPPQVFTDHDAFLAATGGSTASGSVPDLGLVGESVTLGTITLAALPKGNSMAVGAAGTPAAPDWLPLFPGNEIALGYENVEMVLATGTPVYALGFDFYEPNATMPPYGGVPTDSTFEVVMYAGVREVGRFKFNAPDDQPTFIGVWGGVAFDRVTIVDLSGNDDDEYFGEFFVSRRRP